MGLAAIPPGEPWLELDTDLAADLAEKRRLLGERHAEVFVELPDSRPAQQEAQDRIVDALLRDHPGRFGIVGRDSRSAPWVRRSRSTTRRCLRSSAPRAASRKTSA